jgi:hypothetical protein
LLTETPTNSFLFYPGELASLRSSYPSELAKPIDEARRVLSGQIPQDRIYQPRSGHGARTHFFEPEAAVRMLSWANNRFTLVGSPEELAHLNGYAISPGPPLQWVDEHPRAVDWNGVRKIYSDAADEALTELVSYANHTMVCNQRLTARICKAIRDEMAELSREFSDTFELEDAAWESSK